MRIVERIWFGDDAVAAGARAILTPFEGLFRVGVALRSRVGRRGSLPVLPLTTVGVGNLTVGGAGKTPVTSWLCRQLAERGTRPAVILRGYGEDEQLVHAQLTPDIPVFSGADRRASVNAAVAARRDVAVLDDAFQQRQVALVENILLIAAEQWSPNRRLLPAGPWREPAGNMRRATLVLVTRKSVSRKAADEVRREIGIIAPQTANGILALGLDELRRASGKHPPEPLQSLRGARIVAVAGTGNNTAFFAQLTQCGAKVDAVAYADHHRYSARDIQSIVRQAREVSRVVCTLKDAVKLAPAWPVEAPPLWYVTQRIRIEAGRADLEHLLARAVHDATARRMRLATAGAETTIA